MFDVELDGVLCSCSVRGVELESVRPRAGLSIETVSCVSSMTILAVAYVKGTASWGIEAEFSVLVDMLEIDSWKKLHFGYS